MSDNSGKPSEADDIDEADRRNGEPGAADTPTPAGTSPRQRPTGESQAARNREDDPPV